MHNTAHNIPPIIPPAARQLRLLLLPDDNLHQHPALTQQTGWGCWSAALAASVPNSLRKNTARSPLAPVRKVVGCSTLGISMCEFPCDMTKVATRAPGTCKGARTSHNGNSRKFVESGQCPRRRRHAASARPEWVDSRRVATMAHPSADRSHVVC